MTTRNAQSHSQQSDTIHTSYHYCYSQLLTVECGHHTRHLANGCDISRQCISAILVR